MTKRIVQIIPSLDRAGAEKQLSLLAAGLPRDEFEVHVCALTRGGPLADELVAAGIPVRVIGKRWRVDPQAFWRLRRELSRLQPDLVHTRLYAANLYGFAAARACGLRRLVTGQRCVDPWKTGLDLRAERYVARRSSAVVVNGAAVGEFYVRHGFPAEKTRVIANGVAPATPTPVTRAQLLAELGLPDGSRLVAVVGRLWPQKRIKDAIWAVDLLKVIRPDVHLLVIGDGPHRERLLRFRDQVVIRDKVHLLGHRHDVPLMLSHFDVLLSASGYEGQSNAILEAMAAGVPVVATDVPGNRELVAAGVTGYLVPVGDRAAMARRTNKLLDDAPLCRRFGTAGRERARRDFRVEPMVQRHAALYRELLA